MQDAPERLAETPVWSWKQILPVILAPAAVILPFLFLGNASGHDFEFHIASWMDVAWQWRSGIWYPRWAAWANYGFGEPRFIFYPPASWLLGAALGTLLPWQLAPAALIWLALVLAGFAMLRLAREWLAPNDAMLAAIFYAVNPYHLAIVYWRSDFAELLASAVFPLLVLYAVRLARGGTSAIAHLAIVFAFIWVANAPAGVIASYSLALLLVLLAVWNRAPRILVWGAVSVALGLLLAAFYILPAAWEQRWVQITQALSAGLRPEQNFLFTSIHDPEHNLFNLKISSIAAAEIVAAALASLWFPRRNQRQREAWKTLAALGGVSMLMMLPVSKPAWHYLPKLAFVQFPWRWLLPFNVAASMFCLAAGSATRKKWPAPALLAVVLSVTGAAMVRSAWWDKDEVDDFYSAIWQDQGYEGADEYAPLGCDHYDLPHDAPEAAVINDRAAAGEEKTATAGVQVRILRWSPEMKSILVDATEPATLVLRLVDYPAWHAQTNGRPVPIEPREGTAQVMIPVPAGHTVVQVKFVRTRDRIIGVGLSAVGAGILVALILFRRWRPQNR